MLERSNLHSYQEEAVQLIIDKPAAALFLEMGLGKTVSTLTAIYDLLCDYLEISSVLVVAPKHVARSTWVEEVKHWKHLEDLRVVSIEGSPTQRLECLKKRAQVYTIGRDLLPWLVEVMRKRHKTPRFDMLVLDELSSFKNTKAARYKSALALRGIVKRCVGLTGTPAPNTLIDLFAEFKVLDKGVSLGKNKTRYLERFFTPCFGNGYIVYKYGLKQGAKEEIYKCIKPITLSMQAKDYLELPALTIRDIPLQLSKKEMQQYKLLERDAFLELDGVTIDASSAAVLAGKLLQLAGGAIYTEDKEVKEIHAVKIEALKEIIDTSTDGVLVAYSYRHERERILKALEGFKVVEFKTPKDIEDWNKGRYDVAIGHPQSIGHGLNIQQGGATIVWYSLPWSLELYQQFNARLYRQGQKRAVIIHRLISVGTIDEQVSKALAGKDQTQRGLLEALNTRRSRIEYNEL